MSDELEGLDDESGSGGGGGAPAWMATFGDMMSLLLTFFVLLLSFANMDVVKFQTMLGSVQDALGVPAPQVGQHQARSTKAIEIHDQSATPVPSMLQLAMPPMAPTQPVPAVDRELVADIQRVISEQKLEDIVETVVGDRGIMLRVKGQLLFDAGAAELSPESLVFLDEIAKLTRESDYHVSIEGHSDDDPISTPLIPTNWHLSAWRAIAALRYLVEVGGVDPKRVSSAGYAHMRPLVPNDSVENRAINRRVEFVYYRESAPSQSAQALGN